MRVLLLILFAAITGYSAFLVGQIEPGNYVKIYAGSYLIELNLLSFVLLVLVSVFTLYFMIRLFRIIWKAPKSFSSWRMRSNKKRATEALGAGYLSLIKGDWRNAEKSLTTKSDASSIPYVNYLAAAQAAQEQGRMVQRDDYLNAAFKAAPKERLAIGLIKARLHQSAGQYQQAEATLLDIQDIGHNNAQFTAMLMQIYQHTDQWAKANEQLGAARKQSALPSEVLDGIADQAYSSSLSNSTYKDVAWKALPRNQRKRVENILLYVSHLIDNGESSAAEKLIRATLKNQWSDPLVRLYGELKIDKPKKLARVVDGWLLARPESAELNLAAGQLSLQAKELDKAKEYLQQAIELGQLPTAYSRLGEAYEASNDSGKALQLYRSGMTRLASLSQLSTDNEAVEGQLVPVDRC
ncbi:MAG: HemY protein [Arenicella sp.]|jgi:HemY protein